jgi:hypothetical protein
MPEWGCRSRAVILDKRPPTWPLRVAIVAVRVWRSAAEGVDIVCTAIVGGGTSTLRSTVAVIGRGGAGTREVEVLGELIIMSGEWVPEDNRITS